MVLNCASPDEYERQNFCPKLSNASAICKKCEAWQEADRFWRMWFMGGILTNLWRTRTEGWRLHMNDEQSSGGSAGGQSPFGRYNSHFEKDYIFWMKATVVVGVLGAIGLGVSIFIASIRAEMHQARYVTVANWTLELDKIHMEHPELIEYFQAGKTIEKDFKNKGYGMAVAIAEFYMDLMDSMLDTYSDRWPDEGWRNWAEDTFSKSPILRSHLEEQRSWYCKHLYPKYLEWSKKDGNPRAPEQKPCK